MVIEIKIRKFKKSDAPRCEEIIHQCADISKKMSKKEKESLKEYYSLEGILELPKDSDFFVIEKDEKVVGTGRLNKNAITTLYLDPKHHKKGIGTLMLNHLLKKAKKQGKKSVHLDSLLQATDFYKKNGFKDVKLLKSKASQGKCLRMKKIL